MSKRIYLSSPHMCGREIEFVSEAFDTNWIAPTGPHIHAFEQEVAKYIGVKSAVALSSGTAAIHLALIALGVGESDVVFCSSLTFSASCNPIIYQHATPVFIDSEPESFNMSPDALEKAFEKYSPKAVIVVNLYGQSADMDRISAICNKHNVPIIEDSAESLGATYKGRYSGTFGKFGIFSFNGNKIITTSGGGMIVSDDESATEKIRFWSTQARDNAPHYQHSELGYNYRMSNVCAGIGRGQLTVLEERLKQKQAIFHYYQKALSDLAEIQMMPICSYGSPNYWLSTLTIASGCPIRPIDIITALDQANIESRPMWKPMHLQPFYEKYVFFRHDEMQTAVSEVVFDRGLCLPSDTKMTVEDLDKVISIIKGLWRS